MFSALVILPSCSPRTLPFQLAGQYVPGNDNVLSDLEVEHTDTDEISPVLKGVSEPIAGMNGSRC